MTKYINKKTILIASIALLLTIAVGITLAFVFTDTDPVKNVFTPSKVACAVVENGKDPVTDSIVEIGARKEDVQIKNTGNTDAYIRVAVVANWMTADGKNVWATSPVLGTDYSIAYLNTNGWSEGSDGYYYYNSPVAPGELTPVLIKLASLNPNVTPPVGINGETYYLSIEIVASAIQSEPATTVAASWGVTVAADGTISK